MDSKISLQVSDELVNSDSLIARIDTSRHQRFEHIYAALDIAWSNWNNRQETEKCGYTVYVQPKTTSPLTC